MFAEKRHLVKLKLYNKTCLVRESSSHNGQAKACVRYVKANFLIIISFFYKTYNVGCLKEIHQ